MPGRKTRRMRSLAARAMSAFSEDGTSLTRLHLRALMMGSARFRRDSYG